MLTSSAAASTGQSENSLVGAVQKPAALVQHTGVVGFLQAFLNLQEGLTALYDVKQAAQVQQLVVPAKHICQASIFMLLKCHVCTEHSLFATPHYVKLLHDLHFCCTTKRQLYACGVWNSFPTVSMWCLQSLITSGNFHNYVDMAQIVVQPSASDMAHCFPAVDSIRQQSANSLAVCVTHLTCTSGAAACLHSARHGHATGEPQTGRTASLATSAVPHHPCHGGLTAPHLQCTGHTSVAGTSTGGMQCCLWLTIPCLTTVVIMSAT